MGSERHRQSRHPLSEVRCRATLSALLFAIDWFDRAIHVQYPATILHYRMQRNCQVLLQPDVRFFLINGFQSAPHRVVTAYLTHSQQGRIVSIMPQGVDMGIQDFPTL